MGTVGRIARSDTCVGPDAIGLCCMVAWMCRRDDCAVLDVASSGLPLRLEGIARTNWGSVPPGLIHKSMREKGAAWCTASSTSNVK